MPRNPFETTSYSSYIESEGLFDATGIGTLGLSGIVEGLKNAILVRQQAVIFGYLKNEKAIYTSDLINVSNLASDTPERVSSSLKTCRDALMQFLNDPNFSQQGKFYRDVMGFPCESVNGFFHLLDSSGAPTENFIVKLQDLLQSGTTEAEILGLTADPPVLVDNMTVFATACGLYANNILSIANQFSHIHSSLSVPLPLASCSDSHA